MPEFNNLNDLKQIIESIVNAVNTEMVLYVILKDNSILKLDMDNGDLNALTSDFKNALKFKFLDIEYELKNYSQDDELRNCYYIYDLDEITPVMPSIDSVTGNDELGIFSTEKNQISEINGIIAVLKVEDYYVKTYKYISEVEKIAMRKRNFYFLSKSKTRFMKASSDMLNITPRFSLIETCGKFLFMEPESIERQFGLYNIMYNQAIKLIDSLQPHNLIKDINKIKEIVNGNPSLAKRLVAALTNSPVLKKNIQSRIIINFVKGKKSKLGKISIDEDTGKFDLQNSNEVERFVKVLNDGILTSDLTQEDYDVKSKDIMKEIEA